MIALSITEQRIDEFDFRLKRLSDLVRKGLVDPEIGTVSKQAQLLAEHCMMLTPPRSVSQGKTRVRLDVEKIFHPIRAEEMRSKSLYKIVRTGDAAAWDAFARNVRKGPLAQTRAIEPTKELHQANRDRRGRARRTKFVTLQPSYGLLKKLVKDAQERVGWARAGWLRGYLGLGGKRAPSWVTRHAPGNGTLVDARTTPINPFVAVTNLTGWAKRNDEAKRIVSNSIAARARAMRSYFEATMKQAAKGQTAFQAQQSALTEAA